MHRSSGNRPRFGARPAAPGIRDAPSPSATLARQRHNFSVRMDNTMTRSCHLTRFEMSADDRR